MGKVAKDAQLPYAKSKKKISPIGCTVWAWRPFSQQKKPKKWPKFVSIIFALREKTLFFQNLHGRSINTAKMVTGRAEWFSRRPRSPLSHPESFVLVAPGPPEGGVTSPQKWRKWGFSQKQEIHFLGKKESFWEHPYIRPIK